nr:basic salivary proline-rich protein 3-like [Equus asinus]
MCKQNMSLAPRAGPRGWEPRPRPPPAAHCPPLRAGHARQRGTWRQSPGPARAQPGPPRRRPARALPANSGKGPVPARASRGPPKRPAGGAGWRGGGRRTATNPDRAPARTAAPSPPAASRAAASAPGPGEKKEPFQGGATTHQRKRGAERETTTSRLRRRAGATDARTCGRRADGPSGGSGDGSAGQATHPGSTLSGREEKARSARRQPSLGRPTPPAPTYSRRRDPRDPPRLAPAPGPRPRDDVAPAAQRWRSLARASPLATPLGGASPNGEGHILPAASPRRLCAVWPRWLVTAEAAGDPRHATGGRPAGLQRPRQSLYFKPLQTLLEWKRAFLGDLTPRSSPVSPVKKRQEARGVARTSQLPDFPLSPKCKKEDYGQCGHPGPGTR